MRLRLGTVEHDLTTRTLVMGVLEPAPGSQDGDGDASLDGLLARCEQLAGDGADLVDVAGVQVGLGPQAGEGEELERVVPVVAALRSRLDVAVSVETWRSRVLAECCGAGAVVGNDSSGFVDPAYLSTAAQVGATVVATHPRPVSGSSDLVAEVRGFLAQRLAGARAAGIPDERIIVNAGLDLGKSPGQSLTLLRESAALADLGPPLLLGATSTRFLGTLLGLEPDERRVAAHAASALGIARGGRIVRTHDVRGARRVAAVLEALLAARLARVAAGEEDDG